MEGRSLRALASEAKVSYSYLSQVINGKRPASEKVLASSLLKGVFYHLMSVNASVAQG